MSNTGGALSNWSDARREAARERLLRAAWELVREDGLAALTLRQLAKRAGTTTPTVYAYFDSKNAIFDAMFGQAAQEFLECKQAPYDVADPMQRLLVGVHRFFEFCASDVARYQLLFQHPIPGFAPSAESYAAAVAALGHTREQLAAVGIGEQRHLDLFTALVTGLVDQQISNDPGGDRWIRLADEAVRMFVTHCTSKEPTPWKPPSTRSRKASTASPRSPRRSARAG